MANETTVVHALVERGVATGIGQAAAFVMEGMVRVNGRRLINPRGLVAQEDQLSLV